MAFMSGFKGILLAWVLLGGSVQGVFGALPPDKEHQVKAVFLYNFTQFVAWPESAFSGKDAPLVVGILGPDPFKDYLDAVVEGEKAATHPIIIKRFQKLEEVENCHILFVGEPVSQLGEVLRSLKKSQVLTVGDVKGFSEKGGMVGFVTQGGRIRLQVNLDAVKSAELEVSSKLLRLAEIVSGVEE
jgi:hypothetical protein